MVRKTKEETQETRDRIIKAAIDVFYEKGVGKATLENIAASAGMTRGAIYWHFKNKTDLFSALHDQMHRIFMQRLIDNQSTATTQPLQQLAELCIQILLELDSENDLKKSLSIMMLKCDYSGEMAPFLKMQNDQKAESLRRMEAVFEKAKSLGQVSPQADCHLLTLSLWFFIGGVMTEYLRDPAAIDMQALARPLVTHFFKANV